MQCALAHIILMNSATASLSQGCIRELYTHNRCETRQPLLQLVDFEESEANEKEITIRLSDGQHFVDCVLSGNYQISSNTICETKNASSLSQFKKMHIVRLVDYFSKIDESKICKLKIIIRRMTDIAPAQQVVGAPQEIQQFMINCRRTTHKQEQTEYPPNTVKKTMNKEQEPTSGRSEETSIKLEEAMDIQHQNTVPHTQQGYSLMNSMNNHPTAVKIAKKETTNSSYIQNHAQGSADPLTLQQIMSGKEGFSIGRLIRFKSTRKQARDGPMTVCYLGLLDKYGELVRIHLAGRLAMNNQKILKKNRCYYIRGFDLVNVKNSGVQIRLKDKQYKIVQIHNEDYTKHLGGEFFHWDHESEVQNEYVDVIGVIDDIEQKTTYNSTNPVDNKSVIRVVVKNKYKSIRISFWTEQIKMLESFNLKRKDFIIIEDVRKKQSKYYDFEFQSNLIQLSQFASLKQKYQHLLPELVEEVEPQNIMELSKLYDDDPSNNKLRTITAYLTRCHENKIIYRLCDDCKKKVERHASECQECGSENLVFKFNCPIEFSDSTGSIIGILFDTVANKLISKTANEVSELLEEDVQQIFQPLYYRLYQLTVQNRNQRLIVRSAQPMTQMQEVILAKQNVKKIRQFMCPSELWQFSIRP